ncbi:MAG: glutathione S-transferase N-terminal domain-containing protein [Candidatus Omnitrophica bacterium]|nr:glutathione S-transferase N-terminal domain-containing protein [Candidatus Omnitrophota bacterium]
MDKKVTVYGTPTCPYCVKVKQFLKDNSVEFEDIDVAEDPSRAEEILQKSGQMGVPVLEIGEEVIVGFDKGRIQKALGL